MFSPYIVLQQENKKSLDEMLGAVKENMVHTTIQSLNYFIKHFEIETLSYFRIRINLLKNQHMIRKLVV